MALLDDFGSGNELFFFLLKITRKQYSVNLLSNVKKIWK